MILYQKNIRVKSFGQKNIWVEKLLLKKVQKTLVKKTRSDSDLCQEMISVQK